MSGPPTLDYHALDHLIARARGREHAISKEDAHLAEILISEMKAAGYAVEWSGPPPSHYGLDARASLAAPQPLDVERLDGLPQLLREVIRAYEPTMRQRGDHDLLDALYRYEAEYARLGSQEGSAE